MLQNVCKTVGFKKSINSPLEWGGGGAGEGVRVNHIWPAA